MLSRDLIDETAFYRFLSAGLGIIFSSGYDPPWPYRVWSKKGAGRCAENHYPTLSIERLCELPVAELADKNCALFLWATFPNLPQAFTLLNAWGFKFATVAFVWCKLNKKAPTHFMGCGYYTRANAEICIVATKGHPKRVSKSVRQIIESPIERHSKKPDEARRRIVELFGDVPRLELFAREKADGWSVWGNEVSCDVEIDF